MGLVTVKGGKYTCENRGGLDGLDTNNDYTLGAMCLLWVLYTKKD